MKTVTESSPFQFHKGTIRTEDEELVIVLNIDFNSIKVRLELSLRRVNAAVCKFQFHKGTIRTSSFERVSPNKIEISIP